MVEDDLKEVLVRAAEIADTLDVNEAYKPAVFNLVFNVLWGEEEQTKNTQSVSKKSPKKSPPSGTKASKTKRGTGLVEAIKALDEDKFFVSYKTPAEVEQELRKRAINYKRSAISMSLFRLTGPKDNKLFKRDGAGTSKDPWRYQSKDR